MDCFPQNVLYLHFIPRDVIIILRDCSQVSQIPIVRGGRVSYLLQIHSTQCSAIIIIYNIMYTIIFNLMK